MILAAHRRTPITTLVNLQLNIFKFICFVVEVRYEMPQRNTQLYEHRTGPACSVSQRRHGHEISRASCAPHGRSASAAAAAAARAAAPRHPGSIIFRNP